MEYRDGGERGKMEYCGKGEVERRGGGEGEAERRGGGGDEEERRRSKFVRLTSATWDARKHKQY